MKTVKMPTLDRNAKTINVTREFLIRAGQFGSPEFNILLDMQKTNPGFTVAEQKCTRNSDKVVHAALTYDKMVDFMKGYRRCKTMYQDDREKEAERINFLAEQYRQIADWAEEFGAANNDTKKMILARIIEKITVDRNYHITMTFFITEDDFREKAMESASKLEIVEAEDGIWRPRSTHAG